MDLPLENNSQYVLAKENLRLAKKPLSSELGASIDTDMGNTNTNLPPPFAAFFASANIDITASSFSASFSIVATNTEPVTQQFYDSLSYASVLPSSKPTSTGVQQLQLAAKGISVGIRLNGPRHCSPHASLPLRISSPIEMPRRQNLVHCYCQSSCWRFFHRLVCPFS